MLMELKNRGREHDDPMFRLFALACCARLLDDIPRDDDRNAFGKLANLIATGDGDRRCLQAAICCSLHAAVRGTEGAINALRCAINPDAVTAPSVPGNEYEKTVQANLIRAMFDPFADPEPPSKHEEGTAHDPA
jgi:hypothetical protein